jgi:lysozyme
MLDENAALDLAVEFIAKAEGCELQAYADPESPLGLQLAKHEADRASGWAALSGAPWTIGYGSTHGVTPGMTITKAEALYRLRIDLQLAIHALKAKVLDTYEMLTNHQAAALYSFVFNLGTGDPRKPEWSIWKILRAKRFDQVPQQMVLFVNAGGHKVHGLVLRRNAEIALWSTDEPGSVPDAAPPSVVTCSIPTPPTPTDPVPAVKSAHLWTLGLGSLAAAPAAIKGAAEQITTMISPYADQAPALHQVLNYLGMAAAAAVVAGFAMSAMHKRFQRN